MGEEAEEEELEDEPEGEDNEDKVADTLDDDEEFEEQCVALLEESVSRMEDLVAEEATTQEAVAEARENFEAFASTLVTMREARLKTAGQRKQRGYAPGGDTSSSGTEDRKFT